MKTAIITIENGMVSVPQSGDIRMTSFELPHCLRSMFGRLIPTLKPF